MLEGAEMFKKLRGREGQEVLSFFVRENQTIKSEKISLTKRFKHSDHCTPFLSSSSRNLTRESSLDSFDSHTLESQQFI